MDFEDGAAADRAELARRVQDLCAHGLEKFRAGNVAGALLDWNQARAIDTNASLPRTYIERAAHGLDPEQGDIPSGLSLPLTVAADGSASAGGSELDAAVMSLDFSDVSDGADSDDDYLELELELSDGGGQAQHTPATIDVASREFMNAAHTVFGLEAFDEVDAGWTLDSEDEPSEDGGALPPPPERPRAPTTDLGEVHAGIMGVPEQSLQTQAAQEPDLDDLPVLPASRIGGETLDMVPNAEEYRDIATRELTRPAQLELGAAGAETSTETESAFDGFELAPPGTQAARSDTELTVPGGVKSELQPTQGVLSQDALQALGDTGNGDEATREEPTVERPGVVQRGLAMPDLDALFGGPARDDDRHEQDAELKVSFRAGTEGTDDGLEHELTTERSSFALAGEVLDDLRGDAETLDFELTTERPSIRDVGLASVGDDDYTVERHAISGQPAVIVEPSLLEEPSIIHDPARSGAADPLGISLTSGNWEDVRTRIREQVSSSLPQSFTDEHRVRDWVTAFIDRARLELDRGEHGLAATALELALSEQPDSVVAQKMIHRHRDLLLQIYQSYLGDGSRVPILAVPMHELQAESLDSRAVFLLSRIDGTFSVEEILDISGMTALETYRHLSKLALKGILALR